MPHKATDSVTAIRVGVGKANTVRGEFDAFRKLGVSNRTHAVAVALQGGVKPYSFSSSTGFSNGQSKGYEKQ